MVVGKHAIVTNKHLIADALEGLLFINKRDLNGQCIFGEKVELRFKRNDWIDHPDENVDLSVLPIFPKLYKINLEIKDLFINSYNQYLPDKKTWKMFSPVEGVVTIGFPNGFWDDHNNMPITRKGITATHPKLDYRSHEAFWIDITIFPGMSGSPVFILDYGIEYYEGGAYSHGAKTYFIGVLSAMAKYCKDKSGIEISSIPTKSLDEEVLNVISSLGYVIKATKLKDFDSVLENIF